MNGAAVLVLLVGAAVWPFGRERGTDTEATIKDLEARTVAVDTASRISGSEQKAIDSYRALLDLGSEDPLLRAEAMRRLADLQLDAAEAEELQRNVATLGATSSSIDLYRALLASYPDYAKNDLVLYQLARAYEAGGMLDEALAALDRLVRDYPATPLFDEAQFRRGESLFSAKRYAEAEAAYAEVIATGERSSFYEQALYKHGWAVFKQFRHENSLGSFFGLLDRKLGAGAAEPAAADPDPGARYAALSRADQELVADTFRVLSISFSYMDGARSVTEHFARTGARPYAYVAYTNLGDLYLDKQRYQDAALAYEAFVELDPYHAQAPLLQAEVAEAYEQGGFATRVLDAKQVFVERYGPGSPYWQRFSYAQQPEVVAHLKANLTDLAAYHHAAAQQSASADEYAVAARWYRTFIDAFPDDAEVARTNFLLAEVLFESGRFENAALEYERTAYAYPAHAHGAEAGYAALLAYARAESQLENGAREAWHGQGIESAIRFASAYPDHARTPFVLTDAAEKLYALDEFERAATVAAEVVQRVPPVDDSLRRTASTVLAHAQFDLGRYAEAETAYASLMALVPSADPARRELEERLASSIYRQAEQARDAGQLELAVEHFLRVGHAVPGAEVRAVAEYDAAAVLIRLGDWPRAAGVLEGFRAQFPGHALAGDVTANLAVAYLESGDTAHAAGEFERIAEGPGSEEVRREALWRAAELHAASGASAAAADAWARFVAGYPEPVEQAVEARQRLVELAAAADDYPGRLRWLREIVTADAAAGTARTGRTRYLAAKAQLALAEPARDAFRAVRLVAPLQQSLEQKQARMQAALSAYGLAAGYGIAEVTTAATYEIAELYHGLSRDLFDSERPADLSPEELEQYQILLEEQAFPFEERAIEIHAVNAARTADGTYDEWVRGSLAALAVLMPVRYAKDERGESIVAAIR